MSVLHAIILGIVQGLSEFLPISSSGHLILVPELFGWNELTRDPSLNKTFDVALHMGTLIAAVWYFRRDVWRYLLAALQTVKQRSVRTTDERIAWLLLLSAVPGAIVGALFGSKSVSKARTELIVFLTPRVIYDTNQIVDASAELRDRLKRIQKIYKEE